MKIKLTHLYAWNYEIVFLCDCHLRTMCGSARRTVVEEWLVYVLHPFKHSEYNEALVAYPLEGFALRPVYTIIGQNSYYTSFLASLLEENKDFYGFDPSASWMYIQSVLVRAINKQIAGIQYIRFLVSAMLTGSGCLSPKRRKEHILALLFLWIRSSLWYCVR